MSTYTTLIEPAALAAQVNDPKWVVVDCRHDLMHLAERFDERLADLPRE